MTLTNTDWENRKLIRGIAMVISDHCRVRINHSLQKNPGLQADYAKNEYPLFCPAWAEESPCPFLRKNLGTCILKQLPLEDWGHHLHFLAEQDKEQEKKV